ncbi:hypothetical protein [Blautia wexlerae]|nr:hypothetical protein [Blautia wexlerae]MDB6489126.1 hypothetical protein [Blautia wexlerae]
MFPIKYIDNNLVWNKDNEVFAYYELIPYNYSFLSAEQKFIVHDSFRQLIAQSREGKIHALQIATESSIRSMQEQSKKLVTGKLKEVAYQKIDEQTEALVSMIGDNQVDYRFFLGFKLMVTEEQFNLKNIKKSAWLTFTEFLHEVNHTLMNDFVSMPNDEINRYMKMEKLLENKISRRFKVRRLEINDFGYLMEHLYGRDGIAYEDYEYQLPKKKLQKETLIKYYDLIRPTRCVIEENQRYLRLEHEDKESYVSYFTVNAIVGELDFPSSEIFYFQQQQFTFPVDTSMNVEIVENRKALTTVRNKKKELKDLDNHAYQAGSETSSNVVDALDSVDELETDLDQSKESMYKLSYVIRVSAPDLDELKRRCDEVKDFYDDLNVKLVRPAGDMLGLHSEFLPASKRYINDYVQYVKSDFLAGLGLLIIYFLTIYVLVLLNLLRRISKMTIRDFLYFDKQNEKKMFRDSKKRNVIFVLSIILGAISLFLWNSRCTMDNFNKQETLTYLMVSVIMLIISIYGISTTCADMFLTVLLKNKKMKYQNDNLFVARTFASKARTMSFTFGTLSMLILTSLLALNYSSINKASYDISVNLNAPYDVQLFDDKQVFDEYIRVIEEEYTIVNTIEYNIYKEPNHQVQNFFQSEYYDFDPVLKLSDYNRLLELRKMPLLSLNDNEYYIVTNSKFAYKVEDNKDIETITVANKNLKLKGYDTKSYWNSITNTGRFVVVLPDKYVQGLEVSENHLIIDTKEDTDAELENKIKEDMQHQLVKVDENGEINDESYRVNVRGAEIEQQKAMVAIVASLFMYIAFILISAVGTILAVQSLSDSTKYKYRYLTLRRLGINDKSLFKTIRKQLLILFCVPAISAILCSFVMMSSLNNVYQQILGDKHLYLMYFGLNLIIFFLIYSIYWIATYIGFKRNINEES